MAMSVAKTLHMEETLDISLGMGIDMPGRGIDQSPRRLKLDGHIGQHMLDRLEGDDRLAELDPLLGITGSLVKGGLRQAQTQCGNTGPGKIKGLHDGDKAGSLATDQTIFGDSAVFKDQLAWWMMPGSPFFSL